MRVLLVEDDDDLAAGVTAALERRGCAVDRAASLAEAADYLAVGAFDVAVLDRRLPDGDGVTLLSRPGLPPALILTALDGTDQAVHGLDAGADDYMTKPFAVDELHARLKVILRRRANAAETDHTCGALRFETRTRTASVHDAPLRLPRRESMLLEALIRNAGRVVPHDVLEAHVFSLDDGVGQEALPPHASRLRRRLQEAHAGVSLTAMRGIGYLLSEDVS